METYIHPLSDVQSAEIGFGTRIWQFCVVLPGAKIGSNCNICSHCLVEGDAVIGDRVTVKCGVQIWDGVTLEDDVFVGANVAFTNDRYPRSGNHNFILEKTTVKRGASIGENAVVGAGAVVTKDVPDDATVVGNPTRILYHKSIISV